MSIEIDLFEDFREHEIFEHDTDKMSNLQLVAKVFDFELSESNIEKLTNLLDTVNNKRYLSNLSRVTAEQVEKSDIPGFTKERLEAFVELSKRYGSQKSIPLDVVFSSEALGKRLIEDTKDLDHEELGVLFMDNRNRILKKQTQFKGSVSSSMANPRDIVKDALLINATGIIAFHNHPSGDIKPSPADDNFTQSLVAAGKLLDVRVVDHLVLGHNSYFSYTEQGLIDDYKYYAKTMPAGELLKVAERGVTEPSVSYNAGNNMQVPSVTVYSKNGCPQCFGVKKYLESKKIPFMEINVDLHPEFIDVLKEMGIQSTPVTEIEIDSEMKNTQFVRGFDTTQLKAALTQAGLGLSPFEEKINEMKKSDSREEPSIGDKEIGKTKGR